jgi:F-type H+-transporting ATPase subunit b
MLRRNQADMDRFRDELMARSRKEAEQLKAEAERAIQEERSKAVAEVRAFTVDLAIEIATKLLGEQLDAPKQRKLAEQFIEQLPKQSEGPPRSVV